MLYLVFEGMCYQDQTLMLYLVFEGMCYQDQTLMLYLVFEGMCDQDRVGPTVLWYHDSSLTGRRNTQLHYFVIDQNYPH